MNKTRIFFLLLAVIMTVLFSFGTVFAENDGGKQEGDTKANYGFKVTPPSGTDGVVGIAGTVVGAIKMIGYFIAVGMIIYIGIKYLMASASEKADLKGLLVKYCIGAALIVGGVTIADWIFSLNL